MTVTSTCYSLSCGHAVEGNVADCPRCGRRMRSSRAVRTLGVTMALCGMFLVGLMGTITFKMLPVLMHPGVDAYGGGRFNGTDEQASMILSMFGLVIAFGAAAMGIGGWQAVTGRRNRTVTIAILAFAALLFFVARATKAALS